MSSGDADFSPGALIAGKYAITRLVGAGGMGRVYAARHVELGIQVAIKVIDRGGEDEATVRRFLREARAAAALRSLHTVTIHDAGELPGGDPYIVMDLLEGVDLWEYVCQAGAISVDEAVDYVRQAAVVLQMAHDKGIIHRDVKPPNLFRVRMPDGSGRVKVLDFGLAKRLRPGDASVGDPLTADGELLGSPGYMSPEQVEGLRDIDARTDVWSLAATLYSLLTRARPFDGRSLAELFTKILEAEPRDVRTLRADVPSHVAAAIAQGLEKDRERRFASVRDFADALLEPATRRVVTPPPSPVAPLPGVVRTPGPSPVLTPGPSPVLAPGPVLTPGPSPVLAPGALAPGPTLIVAQRPETPAPRPRDGGLLPVLAVVAIALLLAAAGGFVLLRVNGRATSQPP